MEKRTGQLLGGVFGAGAAVGAAFAYFLDRRSGKRRRHQLVSRSAGFVRHGARRTARAARAVSAEAYGVTQKLTHLREEPKDFDDATLAHKVETELFRDPEVPKGQINVNAEAGVVYLRGEVRTPEMIDELVGRTRRIQGVREVESLLHLPKTEPQLPE